MWGSWWWAAVAAAFSGAVENLWPLPEFVQCQGPTIPVCKGLTFTINASASPVQRAFLQRAWHRTLPLLALTNCMHDVSAKAGTPSHSKVLAGIVVVVPHSSATVLLPSLNTPCRHSIHTHTLRSSGSMPLGAQQQQQQQQLTITADSVFGVLHALETLTQLVSPSGHLCGLVQLRDFPVLRWRGLLLDVGRRFVPPMLLRQIVDALAATKMNVLHFHFGDFGAVRVESRRFPSLTRGLRDDNGQPLFYSRADIAALVTYAADRGGAYPLTPPPAPRLAHTHTQCDYDCYLPKMI